MITIAQRVLRAIDDMKRGQVEFALQEAAIAVDVSAQRMATASFIGKKDYKAFLSNYFWILELMALTGIDLEKSSFGSIEIPKVANPKLPDVIYHLIRCNLVHHTGLPANISFAKEREIRFAKGLLVLPEQLIWALLTVIVFTKVNASETSEGDYFLSYGGQEFPICDHWGKEDILRPLHNRDVTVRVVLSDTSFN